MPAVEELLGGVAVVVFGIAQAGEHVGEVDAHDFAAGGGVDDGEHPVVSGILMVKDAGGHEVGVGGLAIVYMIAPIIDELLSRLNEKKVGTVCAVLMIAFAADAAYSHFYPNTGEGITDYGQAEVQETGSQQDAAVN